MRLILLDRDGVLNEERAGCVLRPEELRLIPGAAAALARLNRAGLPVALVTNQSAVGRGLISPRELDAIHEHLAGTLAAAGAWLDLILAATEKPDALPSRRKPAPDMLREAAAHFGVSPDQAVMIGDDLRDVEAAASAGCARILVRTGKGAALAASGVPAELQPVAIAADLAAAVELVLDGQA
jgi:D-glycero-D-manno-heptose 1,7-bisphosphate phosphatase